MALYSTVDPRFVYFDRKAADWNGVIHEKFLLAGNELPLELGMGKFFWVLTKNPHSHKRDLRVEIAQSDWEMKDPQALTADYGYASPDHHKLHSETEINAKDADPANGFTCVALLCQQKYDELCEKVRKIKLSATSTIETLKRMAAATVAPDEADKILRELRLI
jgi:hypothetical protein